jgi:uncharacterized membrane protein YfcA
MSTLPRHPASKPTGAPVVAYPATRGEGIPSIRQSPQQSVDWPLGVFLGVGSVIGAFFGARLAVSEQARRWIVGLLVALIVGELIQLSIRYFGGLEFV